MMTMSGAQSQQLLSCGLVFMEGCNHTLQAAALREGIFLSDEDDEWSAKSTTENFPSFHEGVERSRSRMRSPARLL